MTYQIKMFKGFYNQLNEETINKWLLDNSHEIEHIVNIAHGSYVGGGCMTVTYIQKTNKEKNYDNSCEYR